MKQMKVVRFDIWLVKAVNRHTSVYSSV